MRWGKEIMFAGTFLCRFEPALVRNNLWNDWCWLHKQCLNCSAQSLSQTAPQCSSGSVLPFQSWVTLLFPWRKVFTAQENSDCWRNDAGLFVLCKVCAVSGDCSSCSSSGRAVTTSACVALKVWVLWSRELCICTLFWGVMESEEVSSAPSVQCIFFSLWELKEYSALTYKPCTFLAFSCWKCP